MVTLSHGTSADRARALQRREGRRGLYECSVFLNFEHQNTRCSSTAIERPSKRKATARGADWGTYAARRSSYADSEGSPVPRFYVGGPFIPVSSTGSNGCAGPGRRPRVGVTDGLEWRVTEKAAPALREQPGHGTRESRPRCGAEAVSLPLAGCAASRWLDREEGRDGR